MKLKECAAMPEVRCGRGDILRIIEDFERTGKGVMEVVDYPHANAESCRSSLKCAIRSLTWDNLIQVTVRKGRVFLVYPNRCNK